QLQFCASISIAADLNATMVWRTLWLTHRPPMDPGWQTQHMRVMLKMPQDMLRCGRSSTELSAKNGMSSLSLIHAMSRSSEQQLTIARKIDHRSSHSFQLRWTTTTTTTRIPRISIFHRRS
ncbi:hypothetical protein LPJ72_006206, partial [Coemansia sp. Benny D160-2]